MQNEDRALLDVHAEVLFRHDAGGRLTTMNEPPYDLAPWLYIGSAPSGQCIRYHSTLEPDVVQSIASELAEGVVDIAKLMKILGSVKPIHHCWMGPAYRFGTVSDVATEAVTRITRENKHLLLPNFPYTFEELEDRLPCVAVVHDGAAVSVCSSARHCSKAAEASLYTLPEFRGRNYGALVTKAWAAEVQRTGRVALYSTSWDNFASQAIARKLNLIQYAVDFHIGA